MASKIIKRIKVCKSCGSNLDIVTLKLTLPNKYDKEGNEIFTPSQSVLEKVCVHCVIRFQDAINYSVANAIRLGIKRFPLRVRPLNKASYYIDEQSDLEFSNCFITV